MASATCFIASLILSLPNWVELSVVPGLVEKKLRTIDDEIYLVVHVPHSIVDPLHLVIDALYFVVDIMSGL